MVAILIRAIRDDIETMKRPEEPNDCHDRDEAFEAIAIASLSALDDEDVRGRVSPQRPERPPVDSREPAAASPAVAAAVTMATEAEAEATTAAGAGDAATATTATPATSIVGPPYGKSPSFEQRNEQRSAFSSVQTLPAQPVPPRDKQDQQHRTTSQDSRTSTPMPLPAAVKEEPLPFESPQRYFHQEPPQRQQAEAEAADAADAPAPSYYPYAYQGYPNYYGRYPGYYPPHGGQEGTADSLMSGGQQYQQPYYHHPQEYCDYQQGYYYPAASAGGGDQYSAAYPQHRQQPSHPYYAGGTTPSKATSPAPDALNETPSAVTESTKGTTPSSSMVARKPIDATAAGEGLESSPTHSFEEGKMPALKGILTNARYESHDSPSHQSHHSLMYEPIPLNEIPAIPVLSNPESMHPSSHPSSAAAYPDAAAATEGAYHDAFPTRASPSARSLPPPEASSLVAPPAPRSAPAARRKPQRTLAPSLAPSESGSTGASGGSRDAGGLVGGSWERKFDELTEFKRAHGHCEVPQNYSENTSLGTWVNKQRMEHKNRVEGKNSSLNNWRLEKLQSMGFRWAKRKGQASWDEKYNELLAYKAKFGNCHVPTKYKDNTALGRWVSTQRAEYKKYQEGVAKTSMNADKIRRLEGIGFAWFMAL